MDDLSRIQTDARPVLNRIAASEEQLGLVCPLRAIQVQTFANIADHYDLTDARLGAMLTAFNEGGEMSRTDRVVVRDYIRTLTTRLNAA